MSDTEEKNEQIYKLMLNVLAMREIEYYMHTLNEIKELYSINEDEANIIMSKGKAGVDELLTKKYEPDKVLYDIIFHTELLSEVLMKLDPKRKAFIAKAKEKAKLHFLDEGMQSAKEQARNKGDKAEEKELDYFTYLTS